MHKHPVPSFWILLCIYFSTLELQLSFWQLMLRRIQPCGTVCRQAHLAVLLWMGIFASLGGEKRGGSWLQVSLGCASMATTLSISL